MAHAAIESVDSAHKIGPWNVGRRDMHPRRHQSGPQTGCHQTQTRSDPKRRMTEDGGRCQNQENGRQTPLEDFGRSYLETQHAMVEICGENRPILVLLMAFSASSSFRLLPSASAISRQIPFRAASRPYG